LAGRQPGDARLLQVRRAPHSDDRGGRRRALVRRRAAGRHQFLHLPDTVVHHRRVARTGAGRAQFRPLRRVRELLPPPRRGPSSPAPFACPLPGHHQLLPQLARIAGTGMTPRWQAGILLFSIGLAKKVLIADRLGGLIDPRLRGVSELDLATAWLCLLGYAFQIYFDFSGYSDIAIGFGSLFGIEPPQNFDSPYKAASPREFWRRWHMTLSFWLRDYLYIPLGGNRCGAARRRVNLMATMMLGGLWHGAGWTFLAWGGWHGGLLVL